MNRIFVTGSARVYGRGQAVFIMAQNVRPGRLDLSYRQLVDPPPGSKDRVRTRVQQDDLLVTIVGANTGDVCRVPSELSEHYVCQSVGLMRPVFMSQSPWMELVLCSPGHGRRQYEAFLYGQGRPHLSFEQLRATEIVLPPLAEQERIVAEVERRLSVVEKAEAAVEANLKRADRMRQAILKRAFEGKLVPQDPNDEPASVLLERIRAERERAAAVNGRGKRGRKLPGQLELPGLPSPPDPLSRARERGGRIGR